jgi:hypothetical protein
MIRPVLTLERLFFLEREGKVGYRWGRDGAERETMDYLEFIARVTSHIPDKGQVMVRYYGLYANAQMGPKDVKRHCSIGADGEKLLEMAVTKLGFSARAYDHVLKVARTIADLAGNADIGTPHISEAIQYRMMDRMR